MIEAAMSILKLISLCYNHILEGINKNKDKYHQSRIARFSTNVHSLRGFSRPWRPRKLYHSNIQGVHKWMVQFQRL